MVRRSFVDLRLVWDEYQASIVLVAAALGLTLAQLQPPSAATVEARIPPAPVLIIATATPAPVLTVASVQLLRLPAPIVAYAAPDGTVLGPIEAGREYTPTARLGDAWTLITAANSGPVWVRASELAPLATLPDLAPTAAPQIIYVAAASEPPAQPVVEQSSDTAPSGPVNPHPPRPSADELSPPVRARMSNSSPGVPGQ